MSSERIEIRTPRWMTWIVAAIGLGVILFLALAWLKIIDTPVIPVPLIYLMCAIGIGLFGGGVYMSLYAKPALVIDHEGLFLSQCGRTIPWEEIDKVAAVEIGIRKNNIPHVGVRLVRDSSYKQKKNILDYVFRKIGSADFDYLINTDMLNMRWDNIVERINETRASAGETDTDA